MQVFPSNPSTEFIEYPNACLHTLLLAEINFYPINKHFHNIQESLAYSVRHYSKHFIDNISFNTHDSVMEHVLFYIHPG